MSLHIVILAAGQGKRMHSDTPKVLHQVGGAPMLARVVETALLLQPEKIHIVIGHGGDVIQQTLSHLPVNWVHQSKQLGTGHAVLQTLPFIDLNSHVLILSGDVPLIQAETVKNFVHDCQSQANGQYLGLLLAHVANPTGLGRVVRDDKNAIRAIVEERDASEKERSIKEIYSGICCASASALNQWLPDLSNNNAQNEYYLTEIIRMAVAQHITITSQSVKDPIEIQGVNNRIELERLERAWQKRITTSLMSGGVTLADASRVDVRGQLQCGKDVYIDVNTVFEGDVIIGNHCRIGPNCTLKQVTLGDHCEILANSVLDHVQIGNACQVGPFARLRPGTQLGDHCKVGNFVETKNATFGAQSKANHLSYLGDVVIGQNVNIGAGTITCNYDGVNKHQTIIEDGVFVGSDTQLVAPVIIGKNATIGAGSTIRKNAPAGELTLTITEQKTVYGWSRPRKK